MDANRLNLWCDKAEIAELAQRWAYARDQARWEALQGCYHTDARMTVSWFDGVARDFIAACRTRGAAGAFNKHYIIGTVATVRGTRACAESNVLMVSQGAVSGVDINAQGYFRFLDELAQREGVWRIARRTAVYERDSLVLLDPGASLDLDPAALERIPRPYRYMGYRFVKAGATLRPDIITAGSALEEALRAEGERWLGGSD